MSNKSVCGACSSPTKTVLCNDCMRVFRSDLEQCAWLLGELGITMSRQAVVGRRDGGKNAETPDPVNWAAAEASVKLEAALVACAMAISRDLRIPYRDPVVLLLENSDKMTIWAPAAEHFERIDAAVGRAMKMIDCAPPKSEFRAPCDVEGCAGEWWTIPGDTYVSCDACGVVASEMKVKERLTNMLDGHLYSVTDMALVMSIKAGREVKRQRIYDLTKRTVDPLLPRGRTADGVNLYAVPDAETRLSRSRR